MQEEPMVLPGADLDVGSMPGHWLLARLGKRVLRPGGLELTQTLLERLSIRPTDDVIEFAPGLGTTTRLLFEGSPRSYTAVERDANAAGIVRSLLRDDRDRCVLGSAIETRLEASSASVVLGEAMLTMHTASQKAKIVREAFRLLRPDGRYGIHELALVPDNLDAQKKAEIESALSSAIRVGARPYTVSEWHSLLRAQGFEVTASLTAPMHLLEPRRLMADEGALGAARIAFNILREPPARRRVVAMRATFKKYADYLAAVVLVGRKVTP